LAVLITPLHNSALAPLGLTPLLLLHRCCATGFLS